MISRIVIIMVLVIAFPFMGNAQRKRALLVGISNYHTNGYKVWNNIHGAEDAILMTPELEKKGFTVKSLVNEAATYQGIISALEALISSSKKGDIVYLHFSCHGQPVEDGLLGDSLDEKDGWDEAIVPIDAGKVYSPNGYKGENHITDDKLNALFTKLRKSIGSKGMLYVVMDACHAGEMSRNGLDTIRGTNETLTSKPDNRYNPPRSNIKHFSVETNKTWSPVLFIEACQSRERNTEIRINGKEYGALSYNISLALRTMSTFGKNTQELKDKIKESTKQKGHWPRTQTVVFEE